MDAPSLDGPRLKLARAKEHLRALDSKLRKKRSARKKPYILGREMWPDGRPERFYMEFTADPPVEWGLIVGDAVHSIRSSLDHMTYQLARLVQDPPTTPRRLQFPIFDDKLRYLYGEPRKPGRHAFPFGSGVSRVKQLPPQAQARIERLQPYQRSNPSARQHHPLWRLAEFDNIDKHRLIWLTFHDAKGGITWMNLGRPTAHWVTFRSHKREAKARPLSEMTLEQVAMEDQLTFGIAFEQGYPGFGEWVSPAIGGIIEYVETRVFPRFERLF